MKIYFINTFYQSYFFFFRCCLTLISKFHKSKSILILDLDNTICNTWPLLNIEPDLAKVYSRADCFFGVKDYVSSLVQNRNIILVILTSRNLKYFYATKQWLKYNSLNYQFLFMTNSIDLKFVFYKYLISSRKTIIIDDLSYNHENGEVFFYHNIINHLEKNKNVTYLNYLSLQNLQSHI